MEKENRSQMVMFRITPEEEKAIKEQSEICGLTVSEYIRRRVFGNRVYSKTPKIDMQAITELRKIGGLIKQLWKERIVTPESSQSVLTKLERVIRYIQKEQEK